MNTATLVLKPGREKSVLRRHPWIYNGAIAQVRGDPQAGDTVAVKSADGAFLAWAAYSPKSQIAARVWSFRESEVVDADLIGRRLDAALAYRRRLNIDSDAQRLVYGEADGLPGIVVDRYVGVLVLQITAAGAEAWRDVIVDLLAERFTEAVLYERSDAEVRHLEGLGMRTGPLRGTLPAPLYIQEYGLRFTVDVARGHKTGFYLDQRENRHRVALHARDRDVLNCFAYTGAFTVHTLAAGARSVLSVDSSAEALELARKHVTLNGLDPARCEWRTADAFQELRRLRDQGRRFGLIILDPPKFAPTHQMADKAARGYKDINLTAMKLLEPGGILATFSCSGGVGADLFKKIVAGAAWDAGAEFRLLARMGQAADHPVSLDYPEGEYLKGLLLYRTG
ncbi:MAG: class I SAM-dependent rRNA methyltransferase [Thiobacillaceae bacterium]